MLNLSFIVTRGVLGSGSELRISCAIITTIILYGFYSSYTGDRTSVWATNKAKPTPDWPQADWRERPRELERRSVSLCLVGSAVLLLVRSCRSTEAALATASYSMSMAYVSRYLAQGHELQASAKGEFSSGVITAAIWLGQETAR